MPTVTHGDWRYSFKLFQLVLFLYQCLLKCVPVCKQLGKILGAAHSMGV